MSTNQSLFIENLEWRRAVKHFGEGSVDTRNIMKAIVNAPSSFGLQPYKVFAIRNKDLKEKLRAVSFGQAQVTECDTLFIFCARTDVDARAEEYMTTTGTKESLGPMLTGFLSHLPDKTGWASRQAYIALGFALAAAAEEKIASCPMEGFMGGEVSKILELPENLVPIVYLAVGKQAENDGSYPRFRFTDIISLHSKTNSE
jgi:nitroreductase/dihydropteridine reductase